MITAIYARKSTEQTASEEQKSVARQIALAREYAARKGWAVADEHVYVDDGISGAEFFKRPGYEALMQAVRAAPPFAALIVYELSRIGRDQVRTMNAVIEIVEAGVAIAQVAEDRLVTPQTLDDEVEVLTLQVRAFAATSERKRASRRTYDAMRRKAEARHVTGGTVYGYTNVDVTEPGPDGRPRRLYVTREINAEQAEVVRRVFRMAADGLGLKRIAQRLNQEQVSPPRWNTKGWAPAAIHEMLNRDLYRGVIVWGKSKKVVRRGTRGQERRGEHEWLRVPAPELQVVPDESWRAAHDAMSRRRLNYTADGKRSGRPAGGVESPYLLTGFGQCSECGAGMVVGSRASGHARKLAYLCAYHRERGNTICANRLAAPMDAADAAVLDAVNRDLMRREVVEEAIRQALQILRPSEKERTDREAELQARLAKVEVELDRYAKAIAAGVDSDVVVKEINERKALRDVLRAELAALGARPKATELDVERIEINLRERLTDWQGLLKRHAPEARQVLKQLLVGRLVFAPREDENGRYYEFKGKGSISAVLSGVVLPKGWWPQRDSIPFGPKNFAGLFESPKATLTPLDSIQLAPALSRTTV